MPLMQMPQVASPLAATTIVEIADRSRQIAYNDWQIYAGDTTGDRAGQVFVRESSGVE